MLHDTTSCLRVLTVGFAKSQHNMRNLGRQFRSEQSKRNRSQNCKETIQTLRATARRKNESGHFASQDGLGEDSEKITPSGGSQPRTGWVRRVSSRRIDALR